MMRLDMDGVLVVCLHCVVCVCVCVVVVYVCTDERVFERAPDSDASAMSDVERLALSVDASIRHRSSATTVGGATTTGMDARMIRRQVR
jgi:hypothetical protein